MDQSAETAGPNGIQQYGVISLKSPALSLPPGAAGSVSFSGVPSAPKPGMMDVYALIGKHVNLM